MFRAESKIDYSFFGYWIRHLPSNNFISDKWVLFLIWTSDHKERHGQTKIDKILSAKFLLNLRILRLYRLNAVEPSLGELSNSNSKKSFTYRAKGKGLSCGQHETGADHKKKIPK